MDMSSGSSGGFRVTNERLARAYWYTIAGIVALLAVKRLLGIVESKRRQAARRKSATAAVARPHGYLSQAYATATATAREIAYPQPVYFTGRISKYFSPLPAGRWFLLAAYWTVLLCFLWTDSILGPEDEKYAYRWEKVGYRAAWVSICQIPFIYLLSCKFNPISILTGISYERFNWLHRWAARTIFLTVIVHWSWFYRGWDIASFVSYQMEMMPMVKYGFGAWGVVGWMVLTGFGVVRAQRYELFVAQHVCAAAVLLWLLHVHVPSFAAYYIWMAVGFVAFDWSARIVWALLRNSHVLSRTTKAPGYKVQLEGLPGDMVRINFEDVDFSWQAGQHAYIAIPRLRPFEIHPFTIASSPADERLTMVVKAHSGFTRALLRSVEKGQLEHRAFVSGPWGNPPELLHYDNVILIACASGASFAVPLLQELATKDNCARHVVLHWIVREQEHISWYEEEIRKAIASARGRQVQLQTVVHVTRFSSTPGSNTAFEETLTDTKPDISIEVGSAGASSSASTSSSENEKAASQSGSWRHSQGRPNVESMIRPPVERAVGETAVVVCGGLSITAEARTFVAALSDERAVHKGTGTQGIFLFTETYGW